MIWIAFFLASTAWIMQGIYLAKLTILAFIPFLAIVILRRALTRSLWIAAFVGALVDLFSDDPIGVHALNYVTVVAIFWRLRNHFSSDEPLHLSLFTAFLSSFSTLLQWTLLFLFDRRVPFGGKWVFHDLIAMPVIDALYAFVWFAAPLALFTYLRKVWNLFWLKKKNPSPT